jgi:hypothetical protein
VEGRNFTKKYKHHVNFKEAFVTLFWLDLKVWCWISNIGLVGAGAE